MSKRVSSGQASGKVRAVGAASPSTARKKPRNATTATTAEQRCDDSLKDPNVVLSRIRQLRAERPATPSGPGSTLSVQSVLSDRASTSAPSSIVEVVERDTEEVSSKIEELVVSIVHQIMEGGSFELAVPNRGTANQIYVEELDRNVLGDKVRFNFFFILALTKRVVGRSRKDNF